MQSSPDVCRGGKVFAPPERLEQQSIRDLMSDDNEPNLLLFSCDDKPCPEAAERNKVGGASSIGDRIVRAIHTKEAVVTYLIVGIDLKTHASWHENVSADDVGTARRIARARAAAHGIDLVVAAVIGPNSAVVSDSDPEWTSGLKAA